ncbi:hypothetical protein N656DRAFT_766141 [Canariomyces notabilis]|uniref:Uncharacterized protein n=1 Tax=Canariomyces notabilis TaxID=2074819 RepID=A0AAN6TK87_9PEZI|nr:hypothetical protein N656DRAFT_766141 [Canariomyces arenarius]
MPRNMIPISNLLPVDDEDLHIIEDFFAPFAKKKKELIDSEDCKSPLEKEDKPAADRKAGASGDRTSSRNDDDNEDEADEISQGWVLNPNDEPEPQRNDKKGWAKKLAKAGSVMKYAGDKLASFLDKATEPLAIKNEFPLGRPPAVGGRHYR